MHKLETSDESDVKRVELVRVRSHGFVLSTGLPGACNWANGTGSKSKDLSDPDRAIRSQSSQRHARRVEEKRMPWLQVREKALRRE